MSLLSLSEAVAPAAAPLTKGGDKADKKTTELNFDDVIGKIPHPVAERHSRQGSGGLNQTVETDAEGSLAQGSEDNGAFEKHPNNDLKTVAHETKQISAEAPVEEQLPRQARDIVEYALASNPRPPHRGATEESPKSTDAPGAIVAASATDQKQLEIGEPFDLRQKGNVPTQTSSFEFRGKETTAISADLHKSNPEPIQSSDIKSNVKDAATTTDGARQLKPSATLAPVTAPFAKEVTAIPGGSHQIRPPAPQTRDIEVVAKDAAAVSVVSRQTNPIPAQAAAIETNGREANATLVGFHQTRPEPTQTPAIGRIVKQATTLSTQSNLVSDRPTQALTAAKVETRVDGNPPFTISGQTDEIGREVQKSGGPSVNPATIGSKNEGQNARLHKVQAISEPALSYTAHTRTDLSSAKPESYSTAPLGQTFAVDVRREPSVDKPVAIVQTVKLKIENSGVQPDPGRPEGKLVAEPETPFAAVAKDQIVTRAAVVPQVQAPSSMTIGMNQKDIDFESVSLKADETASVLSSVSTEDAAASTASAPTATFGAIPAASKPVLAQSVGAQLAEQLAKRPQGTIGIMLNPEELGRVQMAVNASESVVAISITAERPETLDLMRRHVDQLIEEFRQMGYEGVDLAFSGGGSTHDDSQNTPSSNVISATSDGADNAIGPNEENPDRPGQQVGVDMRL
ncbi:flagellar hook-length control protein FliK [Falsiruegeria mediterranea]